MTDELLPDGRRRITIRHAELPGVTPGRLGLNRLIRGRVLAGAKARAWARHHVEQVGNLVHFLPGLCAGQTGVAPDPGRRR